MIKNKARLLHVLRYGLVVRISGSHPGGPGSIPGNGILLALDIETKMYVFLNLKKACVSFLMPKILLKTISPTGNRTRAFHVTGGDPHH